MLRKLLFCFAMLVVAGPATADDALRCSREAGDVAIAACTRAINSGAGRPSTNYYTTGATPTTTKATWTVPLPTTPRRYGWILKTRMRTATGASAYRDKGDTDRAIADFTEVIRLDPKGADGVPQPGRHLPRQRRHGPGHCRLHRGDTARSQTM